MGFDLASLLEPKRNQSSESRASARLHDKLSERIPSWLNFLVVWQACQIDETLRRRDGFAVERRNAPGKFINEAVEFGIRKRPIDVTISLRQVTVDVICSQQYFERPATPREAGQSRHRPTSRRETDADFPVRQNRIFSACEADVTCQ